MDAEATLKALDFRPTVDCESIHVRRWFFWTRETQCAAGAELLVRILHYPVQGVTEDGDRVTGCAGAQTVVCLEHAHDLYNSTIGPLVEVIGMVGRCPGCGAEVDDEDDVYQFERL